MTCDSVIEMQERMFCQEKYYAKMICHIHDWMLARGRGPELDKPALYAASELFMWKKLSHLNCDTFTFQKLFTLFMVNYVNFWGEILFNLTQ